MVNSAMKSVQNKPLTPTMENYLEAIFNLGKEKRVVICLFPILLVFDPAFASVMRQMPF